MTSVPQHIPELDDIDNLILAFIARYTNEHGRAPLQREIGKAVYLTPSSLRLRLYKLAWRGYLDINPSKWRNARLTDKGREWIEKYNTAARGTVVK